MPKYDYVIVGSGLAGSVFAQQMTHYGKKCLVLEKRYHIGGNLYDSPTDGVNIHRYGVHIFHTDSQPLINYVNTFTEFFPLKFTVKAQRENKLYSSPFTMHTFKEVWGINSPEEAKKKIANDCIDNIDPTVEGYALRTIGKTLYQMFVEEQMLKHWGIHPSLLPESYLKRIPLRFTWDTNYFLDDYQAIPRSYTTMIANMLYNIDVDVGVDYFARRDYYHKIARKVIYTGEIDRYFNYCFGNLPYRSLHFTYSRPQKGLAADMVRYADSTNDAYRSIDYGRLYGGGLTTVVSNEYAFDYDGSGVPMYPVHTLQAIERYGKYKQLADNTQTLFIGRLARFQYLDMHQVIAMALKAAREEMELS